MKIDDAPALVEALCAVAEKQAFLFLSPTSLQEAKAPEKDEIFIGRISFSGDCAGSISMAMPKALCLDIVSNVLALDDGSMAEEEQTRDVMGELLNVLCGQFLTLVEGAKPVFNLSVPEIRRCSPTEWDALRASVGCRAASVDGHNVLLSLELPAD